MSEKEWLTVLGSKSLPTSCDASISSTIVMKMTPETECNKEEVELAKKVQSLLENIQSLEKESAELKTRRKIVKEEITEIYHRVYFLTGNDKIRQEFEALLKLKATSGDIDGN
jgi:peptidoglycan hydrolase CwlO-like protein